MKGGDNMKKDNLICFQSFIILLLILLLFVVLI